MHGARWRTLPDTLTLVALLLRQEALGAAAGRWVLCRWVQRPMIHEFQLHFSFTMVVIVLRHLNRMLCARARRDAGDRWLRGLCRCQQRGPRRRSRTVPGARSQYHLQTLTLRSAADSRGQRTSATGGDRHGRPQHTPGRLASVFRRVSALSRGLARATSYHACS